MTEQTGGRRVVTNMSVSIDGRYAKPGVPEDLSWVMPYAVTDVARDRGPPRPGQRRRVPGLLAHRHRHGGGRPARRGLREVARRRGQGGLPTGQWTLAGQAAGEHGMLSLVYDRVR